MCTRSRFWSGSYVGAPHGGDAAAVGDQPFGVADEVHDDRPLDRGQPDLVATAGPKKARRPATGRAGTSAVRPRATRAPARTRRSTARIRRQELGHPERLGDVVVGAGVEGPHLRPLVVADGEHDDRHRRPAAERLEHDRARRCRAGRGRAARGRGVRWRRRATPLTRSRLDHLVPAGAEVELRAPADLRLVVDDEHRRSLTAEPCRWLGRHGQRRASP